MYARWLSYDKGFVSIRDEGDTFAAYYHARSSPRRARGVRISIHFPIFRETRPLPKPTSVCTSTTFATGARPRKRDGILSPPSRFRSTTHARAPRRRALHPPLPTMSAWGASGAWASQVRSRSGSRPSPSPTAAGRDEARRAVFPPPAAAPSRARDPARPRSPRRARGRRRLGERLEAPREAGAAPRRARSSAAARGERVAARDRRRFLAVASRAWRERRAQSTRVFFDARNKRDGFFFKSVARPRL